MPIVTQDQLVSPEYQDQLAKMRDPKHMPRWGAGGQRHARVVQELIGQYGIKTLVDYGCGHGMLMADLAKVFKPHQLALVGYDPGMPQFSALPDQTDMVVSTDVLEHVEPEKLNGVLTHIRFLTGKIAYLNIHTQAANAKLPDGRNAHLIQQPAAWWKTKLEQYFSRVERVKGFDDRRPSFVCRG